MTSYYVSLGVLWIGLGVMWLRRASRGIKAPLLTTLLRSKGEPESSRVRVGHALLGIANIGLGIAYLLVLLLKRGHLR